MRPVESPVRRLALRLAQGAMLLFPARERRQPQPARNDPIHMLEQQHLGQQVLILRARLQLAHRFVADPQQLFPRDRVLVFLEPLEDELLVLLLQRAGQAPGRSNAGAAGALEGERGQHGSTCTVTSSSSRSFFRRSSTASAIACAAATLALGSTAIVTSAKRTEPAFAPRDRIP